MGFCQLNVLFIIFCLVSRSVGYRLKVKLIQDLSSKCTQLKLTKVTSQVWLEILKLPTIFSKRPIVDLKNGVDIHVMRYHNLPNYKINWSNTYSLPLKFHIIVCLEVCLLPLYFCSHWLNSIICIKYYFIAKGKRFTNRGHFVVIWTLKE